jgi:hypothetical protein
MSVTLCRLQNPLDTLEILFLVDHRWTALELELRRCGFLKLQYHCPLIWNVTLIHTCASGPWFSFSSEFPSAYINLFTSCDSTYITFSMNWQCSFGFLQGDLRQGCVFKWIYFGGSPGKTTGRLREINREGTLSTHEVWIIYCNCFTQLRFNSAGIFWHTVWHMALHQSLLESCCCSLSLTCGSCSDKLI